MQPISRKELLEKLNMYIGKLINLQIEGGLLVNIVFSEFDYNLEEDILQFKEISNQNTISFNLNNINFIGVENEEIICMLNDKKDTKIKIR